MDNRIKKVSLNSHLLNFKKEERRDQGKEGEGGKEGGREGGPF
jgi:hypothetical protein